MPRQAFERRGIATRTWTYGTRLNVVVVSQSRAGAQEILMVQDAADSREAFVLVQEPGPVRLAGSAGTIEFMRGGPLGGYWRFEARA